MEATSILMREHVLIERALTILERVAGKIGHGQPIVATAVKPLAGFFRDFADEHHHAKEEGMLFPAMSAVGFSPAAGPVAVMLHEHEQGRALVLGISEALDDLGQPGAEERFLAAARGYVMLLRQHIHKENQVLFPMADRALTADAQEELVRRFAEHERLHPDVEARFAQVLDDVEQALGKP